MNTGYEGYTLKALTAVLRTPSTQLAIEHELVDRRYARKLRNFRRYTRRYERIKKERGIHE